VGRYYFDLRDSEGLAVDEEALSYRTFKRPAKRPPCHWRMPRAMVSTDRMAPSIS
jgi:hypothetical protein